jgi:hypothetical protein
MKKLFIFLTLLFSIITINAQDSIEKIKLYNEIKSGMTEDEFISYCQSDPNFNIIKYKNDNIVETSINNNPFYVTPFYNKNNKIYLLLLTCEIKYDSINYETKLKDNLIELFTAVYTVYGKPIFEKWLNYDLIPDGEFSIICQFQKKQIILDIVIYNFNNKYTIGINILDKNYVNNYNNKNYF